MPPEVRAGNGESAVESGEKWKCSFQNILPLLPLDIVAEKR